MAFALPVLLLSAALWAQTVQIQDVGLQGNYRVDEPTRVRLLIDNPQPTAQTIHLLFRVVEEPEVITIQRGRLAADPPPPRVAPVQPVSADSFSQTVSLQPGGQRSMDVPLLIAFFAGRNRLEFEAHTADGRLIAQDSRPLEGGVATDGRLVVILCADDVTCRKTQEAIALSGTTDEQAGKNKTYRFIPLRQPADEWWAYSAVHGIVLAAPSSSISTQQQTALEGYVRHGGKLLLVESLLGKSAFLGAYRLGAPDGKPQHLGFGELYRFAGLDSSLSTLFNQSVVQWLKEQYSPTVRHFIASRQNTSTAPLALRRLGTSFVFPSLAWLLWWLLAYLLVVGVLNFAVLRWLGRREWGWITVPLIALLFAAGFYFSSAAKRPKSLELDEVGIFWLDDRSTLAAAQVGVRVSSPRETSLTVTVPAGPTWMGPLDVLTPILIAEDFSIRNNRRIPRPNRAVELGPEQRFDIALLQWSFRDLKFGDAVPFPGSIRRLESSTLVNQTGKSFQEAIYVTDDKVYFLGPMTAGASANFSAARQEPRLLARTDGPFDPQAASRLRDEWRQAQSRPFSLIELIRRGPSWAEMIGSAPVDLEGADALFLGLADEPMIGADLPDQKFVRKHYSITIVKFLKTP